MPGRPNRRHLLRTTASLGVVAIAGCQGIFGSVGLHAENNDAQRHSLRVEFLKDERTKYQNQFALSPDATREWGDIVSPGEYDVTITLDEDKTESFDFHMGGCTDNQLLVIIRQGGDLFLNLRCHND